MQNTANLDGGMAAGLSMERSVSLVANLVTIAGFVAALLHWVGVDVLPHYSPPSTSAALFLLLIFAAFAGYGTSEILRQRYFEEKSFFFLMTILMIGFSFSFAFIRNYLIIGINGNDRANFESSSFLIGWLLYWMMNTIIFCYGIWFKGKNILWAFATAIFRPSYWAAAATMLIHLLGLPMLLTIFNAGPQAN